MFSTFLPYLINSFEKPVVIFTRARICKTSVKNVTFYILLNFMWVMQKINYMQLYYISTIAVFFFSLSNF